MICDLNEQIQSPTLHYMKRIKTVIEITFKKVHHQQKVKTLAGSGVNQNEEEPGWRSGHDWK